MRRLLDTLGTLFYAVVCGAILLATITNYSKNECFNISIASICLIYGITQVVTIAIKANK